MMELKAKPHWPGFLRIVGFGRIFTFVFDVLHIVSSFKMMH
jgi:hypothetical protein